VVEAGGGASRRGLLARSRRVVRWLVVLVCWVVFVYWWNVVLRRTPPRWVVSILIQVGAGAGVLMALTFGWIAHNLAIARRDRRGGASLFMVATYERDALGRRVAGADAPGIANASRVIIWVDGSTKRYLEAGTPSGPSSPYDSTREQVAGHPLPPAGPWASDS